tara:strand:- start:2201 stop:2452 length:252 start_codon:yes stop_codon:yes gene_type:complete
MMRKLEEEVRDDVSRLLAMLNPGVEESSETYQFVRDRLTRMAIMGTLPPASRPKHSSSQMTSRSSDKNPMIDFSAEKEKFIAP